jgi:peptidoglycan/xylan/chitin deacetylase (PgdA/CDA1 family)
MRSKLSSFKCMLVLCTLGMVSLNVTAQPRTPKKTVQQQTQKNKNAKKYIYLTFDDGPLQGSEYVNKIILAEKIKISVFLVGEHVLMDRTMDDYYKFYEENPYIDEYNHSFSHANEKYDEFYSHTGKAVADFQKNAKLLKFSYKIARLPARNMWRIDGRKRDDIPSGSKTADSLQHIGYKVAGWDIEWQHKGVAATPIQSVDEIYKEICTMAETNNTFTPNNVVVLLHDEMFQKKWEESELKQLIDKLRTNKNFVFEQLRFYPQ